MATTASPSSHSRGSVVPGGLPRLDPPPTPEAAAKHQEDNVKRVKMLRDAYDVKHQRLMKQTQSLAEVKKKLDEVDSLVAREIGHIRSKISGADQQVAIADKEVARIEELLKQAITIRDERLEKKRLLTEHLCVIISETEKDRSQKLANLYRQLEFEEIGVKEARKDLVAAIAEEARRFNSSSNATLQANKATSASPQTSPNGTDAPEPKQQPQQQQSPQRQPQKSPQLQPLAQEAKTAAELDPGEEDTKGDDGLFSGITSWGGATVGAVTTTVGAVSDHVNSLISTEEGELVSSSSSPSISSSSLSLVGGSGTLLEEDENDIPMDKLFEGFSPEDVNDLLK